MSTRRTAGPRGLCWMATSTWVHNNAMHRYPPRLARAHRLPTLTSLHVPPFDALRRAVHESDAPWSLFSVTSAKQRASWWPDGAPAAADVVHNGIDLSAWPFSPRGGNGAAWAGRIAPNKGTHFAVTAAQFAAVPLTIYGPVEDAAYFDRLVRPYLSRQDPLRRSSRRRRARAGPGRCRRLRLHADVGRALRAGRGRGDGLRRSGRCDRQRRGARGRRARGRPLRPAERAGGAGSCDGKGRCGSTARCPALEPRRCSRSIG